MYEAGSGFDYDTTLSKLHKAWLLGDASSVYITQKGSIVVSLKGCESVAQISRNGVIQVSYSSDKEKKQFWRMLHRYIVSEDGTPVGFEPTLITFTLKCPLKPNLKLSACPTSFHYRRIPQFRKARSRISLPYPFKIFILIGIPVLISTFL